MRFAVVRAYMRKEFTELFRTKLIVMVYLLPFMIMLLFGYGIRLEVTHARTLIVDNDKSHLSRLLTDLLLSITATFSIRQCEMRMPSYPV